MKQSNTQIRVLRTLATVFTICAALCSGAAAQTGDPEPPFKSAYRLQPATGGWFQSEGNLGNINFDISDSGVAAGNWSTYRDGKPIWYYFQGAIQYSSDAEEKRTGIIAVVESPLAEVLTGGTCPSCTYVPPVFAEPQHRMRIEFTSNRTARFIYDGTVTIPLIAWMQGMPLLAPRDYSGDWLAVARLDTSGGTRPIHREAIAHMRLDALEGPEVYFPTTSAIGPIADFSPPSSSRRYKMSCVGPNATCTLILSSVFMDADSTNFPLIWIGDNEAGKYLLARENAVLGYFVNNNVTQFRVYGERDRVTLRSSYEPSERSSFGIIEVVLMKLQDGVFDGKEWDDLKFESY